MFFTIPGEDRTQQIARSKELRLHEWWIEGEFNRLFPQKHRTSIRPLVEECAQLASTDSTNDEQKLLLEEVHPRAWDILREYGKDYTPTFAMSEKALQWSRQPAACQCYMNSFEMMCRRKLRDPLSTTSYVEGIIFGPTTGKMLHAWSGEGFSKRAFDWTLYSEMKWARYFGVPFTFVEYFRLLEAGGKKSASIFHRDSFGKIEDEVRAILKRSRRRHPVEKVAFEITIPIHIMV